MHPFVLFSHPRSGSTSLSNCLQLHPDIKIAEEPFHESFVEWNPDERNYRAHIRDTQSLNHELALLFSRYNGIKALDYQLSDELYSQLLLQPGLKVIFLKRVNFLQTAVSIMIAQQTRIWNRDDLSSDIGHVYAHLEVIPIQAVRDTMAYLQACTDYYEGVVTRKPTDMVLKLVMEEFYTDDVAMTRSRLSQVFDFLGVEPVSNPGIDYYLNPATSRLNSQSTYRFVPNVEEIEASLGSDAQGWLFED